MCHTKNFISLGLINLLRYSTKQIHGIHPGTKNNYLLKHISTLHDFTVIYNSLSLLSLLSLRKCIIHINLLSCIVGMHKR